VVDQHKKEKNQAEVTEGEQRREAKIEEEKKRIYIRSYSQHVQ